MTEIIDIVKYLRGIGTVAAEEAADALERLSAVIEQAVKEKEIAQSACTAWQGSFESIEAHLKDRIAMKDQASPETYLRIIQADVSNIARHSKAIVNARWADHARERTARETAEARLAEAVEVIEVQKVDLAFCREAMRHADIDLSMVLPTLSAEMQKAVRKTLGRIDEARRRSTEPSNPPAKQQREGG